MTRKEEILQAADNYKAQFPDGYIKENVYIDAAEWADRTMLDRVCKWLKENIYSSKPAYQLIEELRKAVSK